MKISVVIPTYNEEQYIGKCLESLQKQTDPPDEIIVVDNNCTDKTAEIAKRMGARVISEKEQGMIPARNAGLNAAKFEIIARIDADTIVPPDWIERIKYNFENFKIDALSGPFYYYDGLIKFSFPSRIYFKTMKRILKNNEVLSGSNMMLTKKMWEIVKPLVNLEDKKVHEDIDLSINIIKVKGNIGYDGKLIAGISARRIKGNPKSFFIEYPKRVVSTLRTNKKSN